MELELTAMWWVLIAIFSAQFLGVLWAVSEEKDMPQGYPAEPENERRVQDQDRDAAVDDRRAA